MFGGFSGYRSSGSGRGRRRALEREQRAIAEGLEPRMLLAGFSWTAEEVYLLELVNRARANPMAEQDRLNQMDGPTIDLTAGLTQAEIARLVPSEPLALSEALTLAARMHSLDMAQRDFFDHVNPDGDDPTDRAQHAGYLGVAGENIAAGQETIDQAHREWIASVGHRKNIFSLHTNFTSTFHYDEFGAGFAFTNIGPYFDFYTEMFGVQQNPSRKYILGVVYDDVNGNEFYNIGEGIANVRIDVAPAADPFNIVGTYTTDDAGNYQIAVPAGSYVVRFTNLSTGLAYTAAATVGEFNVKVDARLAQITENDDDHADLGDLAGATLVEVPAGGTGAAAGMIEFAGDTDLFRFVAPESGVIVVRAITGTGGLDVGLAYYSAEGSPLGGGADDGDGTDAVLTFNAVGGRTYYVAVFADDLNSTGVYALTIEHTLGGGGGNPWAAEPGSTLFGTASPPSGALTVSAMNVEGRPIVFRQSAGGAWTVTDLLAAAGGPAVRGDLLTWTDPKDNLAYVVAQSDSGLILYRGNGGSWDFRNLTAEVAGAEMITGAMTSFITIDGLVMVAGLAADGDLIVYQQTGGLGTGGYAWTAFNLTQRDLVPQGLTTPAFTGDLISYVTRWNGLNIAGLDAQGNIHSVWWAPGMEKWSVANLSAITGAAPVVGGLTAYLTSWDGINIAGVNEAGELTVTWWVPAFQGQWANDNLTTLIGGPLVQAESVASYVTSWGGLNVVAADTEGRLVVYWWSPQVVDLMGEDTWIASPLSEIVENGPVPGGPLTGVPYGDTISIVGAEEDGSVFRYWWQVGGMWQAQDLTAIATPV
jgi:uncharacterized protein YkwD